MRKSGGRGDMVLESRHLIGLFGLLVVIFGVTFTLGYLLGRNQSQSTHTLAANAPPIRPATSGASATTPTAKTESPVPPAATTSSDWDAVRGAAGKKIEEKSAKPGKTVAVAGKAPTPEPKPVQKQPAKPGLTASSPSPNDKSLLGAPLVPKGALLVQVAALTKESDALGLAEALQQKKFPAFVLPPSNDQYYRVQVGPYADQQSATLILHKLANEGFKAIIKR